jgi:hypothetical protein
MQEVYVFVYHRLNIVAQCKRDYGTVVHVNVSVTNKSSLTAFLFKFLKPLIQTRAMFALKLERPIMP